MSAITWTLQPLEVSALTDYFKNPRNLTKDQFAQLKKSLDKFGLIDKPIINLDAAHTVIGGHQRLHVLRAEGVKEVDCWIPDRELSAKEVEELNIRLNKNTGGWDFDVLANSWDVPDLIEWGFTERELELGGFDLDAPKGEDPGAQIDKAEELRVKWGVELGQLWKLGEHRLICGDCTDRAVVERVADGEFAELVYTDPPYGYEKEIEGDENIETALSLYAGALANSVTGDNAWAIVDTPKKFISQFIDATEAHGWKTREPVLHMYRNSMANGVYGTNIFELSFVYSKGKPKVNHRHLNGVDVARKAGHDNLHPTQKFPESYGHYLEMFSPPGAVVFDYFLGSGTTLIACECLSRKCRAVEISPGYVAVALQRWADMTGGTPELVSVIQGENT